MTYRLAPLYCRPWTLNNMSPRLIESHYQHNYGAALDRLNAVTEELKLLDVKKTPAPVVSRLKQEQTGLLNSTLLHELYFASLGGDGRSPPETIAGAITRDFGSVNRWRDEFIALAEALGGDAGWVLLTYVPRDGCLINLSATDHTQSIAGGIPILALDMYEHAYHIEFGANPSGYIAAFMRNIDWVSVEGRYQDAVRVAPPRPLVQPEFADVPAISPEDMQALLKSGQKVQFIDTRPRHYATREDAVDGAVWRDPERLEEWIDTLSKEEPVVTFCVYGFHVGCQTAAALRKAGFDARYMSGGYYGWKAIKAPTRLAG
jgi:superoxide dismutase, Fe-Mn family